MKPKNTLTKIIAVLIFVLLPQFLFAELDSQTQEKAFSIMEKTDDVLAYHGDYSATLSLVIDKPGKPQESVQYKIFQRTDSKLMTIVQLFPEAEKGNGYLRQEDNIWAYDPVGRKFTHTSLKEILGNSDISLDDLDQTEYQWRVNYKVSDFKEGTLGKFPVYIITLDAITSKPAYVKTTYYVRKDLNLILKQEDFSGSGRLMRTMLMPKYTKVPSGYVPTQTILRDELNKGENTQQTISELTFDKLPDMIFTKAYLEGLN